MEAAHRTLPGVLRAAASDHADREAVVDGDTRLTYAELHDRVRRTAAALMALGLEKGDRVCLWAPNSWRWEVLALAVTYAGGTLVPVNTRYTGHEAVDLVARTHAKVVAVADGFLGRDQYDELAAAATAQRHDLPTVVLLPYGDQRGTREGVVTWDDLDRLAERHGPRRGGAPCRRGLPRRRRRHPVHLGHHRTQQGRSLGPPPGRLRREPHGRSAARSRPPTGTSWSTRSSTASATRPASSWPC